MVLVFEHEQLVHLDRGTWHWVSLKQFRIEQDHHSLHGPYRLECISARSFGPARPAVAHALLQAWAEEATDGAPSRPVQSELDTKVYPLLETTALYRLPDLRQDAEHEWGWVVGNPDFHEYVAIDRGRDPGILTLIVAADD